MGEGGQGVDPRKSDALWTDSCYTTEVSLLSASTEAIEEAEGYDVPSRRTQRNFALGLCVSEPILIFADAAG